jgi:transposase
LAQSPFKGHVFVSRGRRGDIVKLLWFDGQGLLLLSDRLKRGRFNLPQATSGSVAPTPAQPFMLLASTNWRMPPRTQRPELAA